MIIIHTVIILPKSPLIRSCYWLYWNALISSNWMKDPRNSDKNPQKFRRLSKYNETWGFIFVSEQEHKIVKCLKIQLISLCPHNVLLNFIYKRSSHAQWQIWEEALGTRPPLGANSFSFMQFLVNSSNNRLTHSPLGLAALLAKS